MRVLRLADMTALLQHVVVRQAERRPDAIALVMDQQRMTYGQLEVASNQLARLLKAAGCRKGDRVCFLMPKSPAAIVSMLGILKADCVHVPLDPASPASRLATIVESCDSGWILAAGRVSRLLDELLSGAGRSRSISVGWVDEENEMTGSVRPKFVRDDLLHFAGSPVDSRNASEDPAHILFTSGSTGTPKGVVITHANVLRFVEWAVGYFGIGCSDRHSGHPPLHFDLSQFDIFGTFAGGAELHLVPAEVSLLPNRLADFIRRSDLTQWFSVPSVLNYMAKFDVVQPHDFPGLERVLWCGEVLPTPALIYWMRRLPHVRFTNLYGPTETTIASSYYTVPACPDDPCQAIPIGRACAGEELLLLGEDLQPVPCGETGDLYIGGVGLSPGYWGDPQKTAAAFVQRRGTGGASTRLYKSGDLARIGADGLVYYLGRADSQIKSRGYRIELGEIEAALHAVVGVKECAVVAIPSDGFEGTTLCCAYVSAFPATLDAAALLNQLRTRLPSYMFPTRWAALHHLPKNSSGKIDRPQLRRMFEQDGIETRGATQAARLC
jgi:amino acid adenylation domain-containing protein